MALGSAAQMAWAVGYPHSQPQPHLKLQGVPLMSTALHVRALPQGAWPRISLRCWAGLVAEAWLPWKQRAQVVAAAQATQGREREYHELGTA